MMEDAEKTSIFVEKMADFFRYNVKKGEEDATLEEELEAVDNYIYILNVRFAGDIHFSKKVECDVEKCACSQHDPAAGCGKTRSIMESAILTGKAILN